MSFLLFPHSFYRLCALNYSFSNFSSREFDVIFVVKGQNTWTIFLKDLSSSLNWYLAKIIISLSPVDPIKKIVSF